MRRLPSYLVRAGYTVLELLFAVAVSTVVFLGIYTVLNSANILAAKSFAINITGTQARVTLDKIQMMLQEAYYVTGPISAEGAILPNNLSITGTTAVNMGLAPVISGTAAIISGTGDGIAFNRILGGPYLVNVASGGTGGIALSATSIQFTADVTGNPGFVPPPVPQPNDILSIFTTAALTGTSPQVNAPLGSILSSSTVGNLVTYTVALTGHMVTGTANTPTNLPLQFDAQQNPITPSAQLLRPTAFVIVYPTTQALKNNPPATPQMRYIDSYVTGTSGNIDVTKYTSLVTSEIQPATSGTGTGAVTLDPNPSEFAILQMNSRPFVSVIVHVRSQNYDNYLKYRGRTDFSTFMGLGSMISLKSVPN